ncbi:branched-chain amino acid ABC transporter permease [Aureimonas mangrovi]|uniref:branched-chain amino acid ABC transporter permease n=1 Tax=Aureimonas mangrovi TaxID=2758041 RepID=UPI00163DB0A4|nr:branched-chain amino acid ABC transporter permease [Aureimonas mangrovi]
MSARPVAEYAFYALLVAGALVFPFLATNEYQVYVMALAFIWAIAAMGLNLIVGYTGQLNLAHAGFMAIGAYTTGLLTVDYGVPFWLALLLSGPVAAFLGFFAGILSLRLKTHFFSIFTLCVGYIVYLVIEKWDVVTHGTVGVIGIPAPSPIGPISFDSTRALYFMVLAFLVATIFFKRRLVRSLVGRSFMAIRNSDELAEALGINLMRTKVVAFMLSTFIAGLAGGLYAGFVRFLGPDLAREYHTFDMIAFVLVGGIGTLMGPVLGAISITWLTQSLQFLENYRMIVFGPMLILLVMFMPHGIIGTFGRWQARRREKQMRASRGAGRVGAEARAHG